MPIGLPRRTRGIPVDETDLVLRVLDQTSGDLTTRELVLATGLSDREVLEQAHDLYNAGEVNGRRELHWSAVR